MEHNLGFTLVFTAKKGFFFLRASVTATLKKMLKLPMAMFFKYKQSHAFPHLFSCFSLG